MTLRSFSCTDFRCLASASFEPDSRYNLIYGPNASGKTSLLEAIAYLGRGRSFRGAPTGSLIRHGASEFLLFGRVHTGFREVGVGVRNGGAGLEVRVDGEHGGGAAALVTALPLQIVDPEVHHLVAGGPEYRRRYLDWLAFHVEHAYLDLWRKFRRVLRQRNAALRNAASPALKVWDAEFVELALAIDQARQRALSRALVHLDAVASRLLGSVVRFEYRRGWPAGGNLPDALSVGLDRDLQTGSTAAGPQRADLKLIYDERQARKLVSRGQQKLLACAMILAATRLAQGELQRPLLLLLDDPAAELDGGSLERVMAEVTDLGSQVIATALHDHRDLFAGEAALFHVEQGVLAPG